LIFASPATVRNTTETFPPPPQSSQNIGNTRTFYGRMGWRRFTSVFQAGATPRGAGISTLRDWRRSANCSSPPARSTALKSMDRSTPCNALNVTPSGTPKPLMTSSSASRRRASSPTCAACAKSTAKLQVRRRAFRPVSRATAPRHPSRSRSCPPARFTPARPRQRQSLAQEAVAPCRGNPSRELYRPGVRAPAQAP